MSADSNEGELLTEWLNEMLLNEKKYLEPLLDTKSTVLLKDVCRLSRQDEHVFTLSVDILEEYIRKKTAKEEEIDDPALTLVATVFICGKFVGEQDIKIQLFQNILRQITGQIYDTKKIKLKEIEILTALDHHLPINSVIDDMKTFIAKFEKQSRIKVSVISLCCETLVILYLTRTSWFYSLKNMYTINNEAMEVFKKLIQNRFYLPIGILIYVFKMTSYKNTLDVESILEDLANGSKIHKDHLNALISKITEITDQFQE